MSETWTADLPDQIGGGSPGARRAARRTALTALVGAAALAVAGTGVGVVAYLSGGGPQPEDVLPDNVVAMAKVDLNPPASQKLAVYRLAKKFPSTSKQVNNQDDVQDQLLRELFRDSDVDYARDVRPWIGDRAAVAVVPVPGDHPVPLLAVAFTDHDKAQQSLQRLASKDDTAFAFSTHADYVFIGDDKSVVDTAAHAGHVLADVERYRSAVDTLDGDQIFTAWGDVDAVWRAVPERSRPTVERAPSGRVVVGGHATDDGVELVGHTLGLRTGGSGTGATAPQRGTGLAGRLPADVVGVVAGTGLADSLAANVGQLRSGGDPLHVGELVTRTGIDVPRDLRALLGTETAIAVLGKKQGVVLSRGTDVPAARAVLDRMVRFEAGMSQGDTGDAARAPGFPADQVRGVDGGVVIGTTTEAATRAAQGDGALARSASFRRAVPDADQAAVVGFLDVQRAIALADPRGQRNEDAAQLESVGLSVRPGADGEFRLRVTVR